MIFQRKQRLRNWHDENGVLWAQRQTRDPGFTLWHDTNSKPFKVYDPDYEVQLPAYTDLDAKHRERLYAKHRHAAARLMRRTEP